MERSQFHVILQVVVPLHRRLHTQFFLLQLLGDRSISVSGFHLHYPTWSRISAIGIRNCSGLVLFLLFLNLLHILHTLPFLELAPMSPRTILISGTNQGLGFHAAAHLLAKPNILLFAGARVLAAGQKAFENVKIHETSELVSIQLDITDPKSIEAAKKTVEEVLKEKSLSGLDVLVNNAGRASGSFEDIYAVNVFGTAALTKAFRPLLSTSGASIVNVSSSLGSIKNMATTNIYASHFLEYSSSKSALNSLTCMWASQEKANKTNVRVVSLCPGYNATNLNGYGKASAIPASDPADGSKIIVEAALEVGGPTQVFYDKQGPIEW